MISLISHKKYFGKYRFQKLETIFLIFIAKHFFFLKILFLDAKAYHPDRFSRRQIVVYACVLLQSYIINKYNIENASFNFFLLHKTAKVSLTKFKLKSIQLKHNTEINLILNEVFSL